MGSEKMNRKLLGLGLTIVFVAILVTPALAMKGQTKQDFKLFFQGLPPSATNMKEANGNVIHKDGVVIVGGEFYVQIGTDGATEDIAKEYMEYECDMDWVTHSKPEQFFTVHVFETISIYDSDMIHDESTLRGTLMLTSIGDNRGGHGGNFAGHGTGEFKGVKIRGASEPLAISPTNPDPPYYYVQLTRIGTVMGWPTP
jgi:hypothetical protein